MLRTSIQLKAVVIGMMLALSYNIYSEPEGGEISETDFSTISRGFRGTADAITLDSNVSVSGDLALGGTLEFADGSVQSTAARAGSSGLYGNRIADVVPPEAFVEICFKNGALMFDIHVVSEPTAGGFCLPGDVGYLIERDERTAVDWTTAKATCLFQGMRLPEPFEFQYACDGEAVLGLINMTDNWEWTSNGAIPLVSASGNPGVATQIMGSGSCAHGSWGWLGRGNGNRESNAYRCAL